MVEARGSVGSMYTPAPSRDAQGTSGYALDAASGTSTYLGAEISKLLGSFMVSHYVGVFLEGVGGGGRGWEVGEGEEGWYWQRGMGRAGGGKSALPIGQQQKI